MGFLVCISLCTSVSISLGLKTRCRVTELKAKHSLNTDCAGGLVAQSWPTLCDPMTVVSQTPLSMGVSRQKHWSGLPFPSPGDLPDPGIEPGSAAFQADSLLSEPPGKSKNFIFLSFPPECYLFKANDCLLGPLSHSRTQRRTWHNEQAQKWH